MFDVILGLIVGKPERFDPAGATITLDELVLEIVGPRNSFPIITNFDCGHTHPMFTIAEMTRATLIVGREFDATVIVEESMVTEG